MLSGYDETILVVDDDDGVRAMIKAALESEGYSVLVAKNGADALDVAADYAMRIMSGALRREGGFVHRGDNCSGVNGVHGLATNAGSSEAVVR